MGVLSETAVFCRNHPTTTPHPPSSSTKENYQRNICGTPWFQRILSWEIPLPVYSVILHLCQRVLFFHWDLFRMLLYVYIEISLYLYICTYREREREGGRGRERERERAVPVLIIYSPDSLIQNMWHVLLDAVEFRYWLVMRGVLCMLERG